MTATFLTVAGTFAAIAAACRRRRPCERIRRTQTQRVGAGIDRTCTCSSVLSHRSSRKYCRARIAHRCDQRVGSSLRISAVPTSAIRVTPAATRAASSGTRSPLSATQVLPATAAPKFCSLSPSTSSVRRLRVFTPINNCPCRRRCSVAEQFRGGSLLHQTTPARRTSHGPRRSRAFLAVSRHPAWS